jgi:hypothetical protein
MTLWIRNCCERCLLARNPFGKLAATCKSTLRQARLFANYEIWLGAPRRSLNAVDKQDQVNQRMEF